MRLEIVHLGGPLRGRTHRLDEPMVRIGADAGLEIRLQGPGVLGCHAEIRCRDARATLIAHGSVSLNGTSVGEVELEDGDLIELTDGIRLRVNLLLEDGERARAYRALLAQGTSSGLPLDSRRVLAGASGAVLTVLFTAILACGAFWAARRQSERPGLSEEVLAERSRGSARAAAQQRVYEQRVTALAGELNQLEQRMANQSEVEKRVGEVQRAVAEVETSVLDHVTTEVERSLGRRPELREARDVVERLRASDAAAEKIIARYSGSVCVIQGSYGFGRVGDDGKFKFLHEASAEMLKDVELPGNKVPLMLDGNGPVFQVEYTGTGFMVDKSGIVLTNRHIAEPWWKNAAARPLIEDGYEPRFLALRAYFPGRKTPVIIRRKRTLVSEDADLAALFFAPFRGQPRALGLADPKTIVAGRRVLLLGYPTGLDALLAKSRTEFTDRLAREGIESPGKILGALAKDDLVRPLPTQGHISDVLDDKIVFDAATAVGGSGGPLLDMEGRVVAINYGILKAFRGANFGVPVSFAADLVKRALAR